MGTLQDFLNTLKGQASGASGGNSAAASTTTVAALSPAQTTDPVIENWNKIFPYSFSVNAIDKDSGYTVNQLADIQLGLDSVSIDLMLPPAAISISTPFANVVTATNKGILEESNGVIFRNIAIRGNTGVHAARPTYSAVGATGVSRVLQAVFPGAYSAFQNTASKVQNSFGNLFGSKKDSSGPQTKPEPPYNQTGYYQFWLLNNFFVKYAQAKKQPGGEKIRLVFNCPKDNIAYVCTPVSFDLARDASSPLKYNYSIVLKSWEIVAPQGSAVNPYKLPSSTNITSIKNLLGAIKACRAAIQSASNIISGFQGDINNILQVLNQSVLAIKDIAGIAGQLSDVFPTLKANAELLAKTNSAQFAQVASDYPNYSNLSVVLTAGAVKSLPNINAKLGSFSASAVTSASKATNLNGQAVSATGNSSQANPASVQAINTILSDITVTENTPITKLGTLPTAVAAQIAAQQTAATQLNTGDIRTLASNLQQTSENLAYSSGMMDATYASTYGLPTPGTAPRTPTIDDILLQVQIEQGRDALLQTVSTNTIYQDSTPNSFKNANQFLSPTDQVTVPTSQYPVIVPKGLTLEQIAIKYLNDASRAREIAILNNLRAPYIDEDGFTLPISLASGRTFIVSSASNLTLNQQITISGSGVASTRRHVLNIQELSTNQFKITVDGNDNLDIFSSSTSPYITARIPGCIGSGDTVMIPSSDGANELQNSRNTTLLEQLSYAERVFLIDMALDENSDITFGPNGDIARSFGYNNAIQALRLIVETEKKELELHPSYGVEVNIGERINQDLLTTFQDSIKRAVTSDPRFAFATVNVTLDGTALNIFVEAYGAGGSGRIPVQFKVAI